MVVELKAREFQTNPDKDLMASIRNPKICFCFDVKMCSQKSRQIELSVFPILPALKKWKKLKDAGPCES